MERNLYRLTLFSSCLAMSICQPGSAAPSNLRFAHYAMLLAQNDEPLFTPATR
jgi:hypothetical protein